MATRVRLLIDYVPATKPGEAGSGGASAGDHVQIPILNVVDDKLPANEEERNFVLNLFRLTMFAVRNHIMQTVGGRAVSTQELHEMVGEPTQPSET